MSLRDSLLAYAVTMRYDEKGFDDYPVKAIPLSRALDVLNRQDKEQEYEYCVLFPRVDNEAHRGPFKTAQEAEDWIKSAEDDGFKKGVFFVGRRPTGKWEIV